MTERKEIDLLVRAHLEGKGTLKGVAKDIGELEKSIESQAAAAKAGESDLEKLLVGLRTQQRVAKEAARALDTTAQFERQTEALAKYGARLEQARQRQAAFDATLIKGAELSARQVRDQTRLAAAVDRAAAAYQKADARLQGTTERLRQYGVNTDRLANEQNRLVAVIGTATIAMRAQEDAIDRATAAQKRFASSDVNAALGRIKSTVLALAAAYVGVQQAAGLARDSVNAFSSREGIRNQLALSVGNDRAAIDAEYEYVKAQADRIGIEFDRAAKAYAKFSAAATLAGRSRQEIRYIWEAFAEVGRVANLSADDLDGVFKALEQITSKGKIQAEELRGQLGDRLFGAFQIAAKALKDTYPDLDKAMERGEVSAEQLVAIAEQYRKTVADQLPAAMRSTAAEQARFTNAVLEFKQAIADAGWADAFTAALKEIAAALESEDGKRFAEALAAGFSTAADLVVWLLKNLDSVLIVAKALAGLWAINAAGKAAAGVVDYAKSLRQLSADLATAVKGLGLMRGAFLGLQAGLIGWSIGAWAAEEFEVVRKAGIALVTGLEEAWTRIKAGAQILWEEVPRLAKNAFAAMLNAVTWGTRQMLEVLQKGFQAIGRDDLAGKVGQVLESLTAKYEQQSDRVAEIRAQMERDIQGIRDIGDQMWRDAERRPAAPSPASAAGTPTARPVITPSGKTAPAGGDADLAKRQRLVDEIRRALESLDAKIDRAQTDSLRGQLDAIDSQYAELSRKIAKVGGATGAEFMRRLEDSLNQLRAQTLAKLNAGLADDRAALLAKLDAVDAAAGRKTKTDLDARLAAIRTQYEATYREIADFRTKLEANGRSTGEVDAARARLDAGIAELQQLETQRFRKDELKRLEEGINNVLSTRSDRLRSIADQEAAGLITGAQARTQMEETITAIQPQLVTMVDTAIVFAETLRGAFDPLVIDAFIARLQLAKVSGQGLGQEFKLLDKHVDEMIATRSVQAFDDMAQSIAGAVAGTQSWGEAIRGAGNAFLKFAADFLREIGMMIAKALILKTIQNSGWGGMVATAVNAAVQHSGGTVGSVSNRSRVVSPFTLMGAPRYHTGGIAGLAPDEYPAILKRNEEVLSTGDPRNVLNGGLKRREGGNTGTRFVLVDDRSKVAEAMASSEGEEVTLVHLRRNISTIKQWMR